MISIAGSTDRQFIFPSDLPSATAYYRDVDRILTYLPHIQLVARYGPDQFRALYQTIELGVYRVRIYCDMQIHFDETTHTLHVDPLYGPTPVKQSVSVQSLTAQGFFTSRSIFHARDHAAEIDYRLQLKASLPKPLGLRLIPDAVINQIADSIVDWRIDEIAEGFIDRSIKEYRHRISLPPARPKLCPAALPLRAGRAPRGHQID
jgi:hypothetical protein